MSASPLHRDSAPSADREHDRPHPLQIEAWRSLGATGRTHLGIQLRRQARRWKLSSLRTQHPDWTDAQLRAELAQIYLNRQIVPPDNAPAKQSIYRDFFVRFDRKSGTGEPQLHPTP